MKLEDRQLIAAPLALVWEVTLDVERWPEWTPTVERVQRVDAGPFAVGSRAKLQQPGMPEAEWRVTELRENEGFTWETRVRGMRMVATHSLRSSGAGTLNVLELELFGFVAALLWPLIRTPIRRALGRENAGLKKWCEARVQEAR